MSYKKIFQSGIFAAGVFASGLFRGRGGARALVGLRVGAVAILQSGAARAAVLK